MNQEVGWGSRSWLGVTPRTGGVSFLLSFSSLFFFVFFSRLPSGWRHMRGGQSVGVKLRHAISFRHLKSGVLEELEKARQGAMNDRAIAIQKVRRRRGPHGCARP